jgi:formylglycine-generating enzyme required for sulfatase activity
MLIMVFFTIFGFVVIISSLVFLRNLTLAYSVTKLQQNMSALKATIKVQQQEIFVQQEKVFALEKEKAALVREHEKSTKKLTKQLHQLQTSLQSLREEMAINIRIANNVFRDRLRDGSLGPEMVVIPKGQFRMGDIIGRGENDEQAPHEVSLNRFAISRYEVTFAEYDRFAIATGREKPSDEGWGREDRPVINVSYQDAIAYTQWLSQQTGKHYRLPTEAQWEYAARAGKETQYSWGNEFRYNRANCNGCGNQWDGKQTAPVGSFAPNAFGVYNMVGNVMEWTCSKYEKKHGGEEQKCLTNLTSRNAFLIIRGFSFNEPQDVLNRYRLKLKSKQKASNIGLRIVKIK